MDTAFETVIVGAGAAGLTTAKHLIDQGRRILLVDDHARVGDVWRERYRSLRLFTPRRYAELPGLRLDIGFFEYPTATQFGDYLERYAARFALPVRSGVRVVRLERDAGARDAGSLGEGPRSGVSPTGPFRVELDDGTALRATTVVVATGNHRIAVRPGLAERLAPSIRQLHSLDYLGPEQLADGPVLVVGAGNSGTDLALEAAAAGHRVVLAGRHPGHVPADIDRPIGNLVAGLFIGRMRRATADTERGRRMWQAARGHGVMLVRNTPRDLERAGIVRLGRIDDVDAAGRPVIDGTAIEAATVVWCTGSRPDFGWIRLGGVLDGDGWPVHARGLVGAQPGLAFVGLPFQYSMASPTLMGMDRDARYVAEHLFDHATESPEAPSNSPRAKLGDPQDAGHGPTLTRSEA
ncbi:flavin-containing monooxygenase [Agromyces soli]